MTVYNYEATTEDELSLRDFRDDLVEVLSKDCLVSMDEGWWKNRNALCPILKLSAIKIVLLCGAVKRYLC